MGDSVPKTALLVKYVLSAQKKRGQTECPQERRENVMQEARKREPF
jgi:hypothetical protein